MITSEAIPTVTPSSAPCRLDPMHPFLLTTWSFGPVGNDAAFPILIEGGAALDAVVAAATVFEDDPTIDSVGVGGLPDADGEVSLDGAIMTDPRRCGAVCIIRHYPNPVQIARRVMEKTIHISLCGAGAEEFALREGFERRPLLTDKSRGVWEDWRRDPRNIDRDRFRGWLPPINKEEMEGIDATRIRASDVAGPTGGPHGSHDTVSIIGRDSDGKLAVACSTSGMAFKVPGRVGDSPIIGQGLYCDQKAGAAAATGTGELISGVCGSFLVVEHMRNGASPHDAIKRTLERIAESYKLVHEHQVAFIAAAPSGEWASGSLRPGFHHTITDENGTRVENPHFVLMDS
ncbi:MAG: isoaspartyl peptidase/L-asparaginase [Planctomycetota bacterium]|nr:isoaspartyl peptidase/L-asparaginase [Planctomycetota bacterium]